MTDRPTDCEQNNHLNYRLQITDRPTDCEQNNHLNYRLQITDRPTDCEQNNHLNYWVQMTDRPTDCEQNNHLNYKLQITDRPTDCEQNNHLNYRLQLTDRPTDWKEQLFKTRPQTGLLSVNRPTTLGPPLSGAQQHCGSSRCGFHLPWSRKETSPEKKREKKRKKREEDLDWKSDGSLFNSNAISTSPFYGHADKCSLCNNSDGLSTLLSWINLHVHTSTHTKISIKSKPWAQRNDVRSYNYAVIIIEIVCFISCHYYLQQ